MKRAFVVLALMSALVACVVPPTEIQPVPITPSNEIAGATVVRRPIPEPALPAVSATPRDVCRRSNGRVYTANGVEITKQTEAEYDRKVMRVVFKSN